MHLHSPRRLQERPRLATDHRHQFLQRTHDHRHLQTLHTAEDLLQGGAGVVAAGRVVRETQEEEMANGGGGLDAGEVGVDVGEEGNVGVLGLETHCEAARPQTQSHAFRFRLRP